MHASEWNQPFFGSVGTRIIRPISRFGTLSGSEFFSTDCSAARGRSCWPDRCVCRTCPRWGMSVGPQNSSRAFVVPICKASKIFARHRHRRRYFRIGRRKNPNMPTGAHRVQWWVRNEGVFLGPTPCQCIWWVKYIGNTYLANSHNVIRELIQ